MTHAQYDCDLIVKQKEQELALCKQVLEVQGETIAQQAAVIEQMRYGLKESLEVAYGEFGPGHMSKLLEQLIALQPCPEVLNKVRADAVAKFAEDAGLNQQWVENYICRIEREGK